MKKKRLLFAKCLFCKDRFHHYYSSTGKYCSNQCQQDFELKKSFARIRLYGKKPDGMSIVVIKKFLMRNHRRCSQCKLTVWCSKPIPLELDHKDGNSDNWYLYNLRLLCPNCHAQTDTYKGKNKGKGRHARKERYAAGKSY